ncbi:putative bifunctional diguanylate cyclase/phosphodiesterase [Caulobacter segnis]|uniref:putative bifunctional diguanylate cyclase/phosphodiesterase n=1 Tax=Caulobacter segnis TaxID=88688 RepID=UPI001CBF59B9|nr:EAL domain-containing protein [Caulobacter segnis]UAL09955.1 EAL domain-containing protein [Caulobacter segnis]
MRTAASTLIHRGLSALYARLVPHVPEAMAGRVRMEQVQSILRMTPVMMGANIVIALLVGAAGLASPHTVALTIWAALVISYALLGLRGWFAARRRKGGKSTVSQRGVNRLVIQAGLLGCLWAALPILTMPKEQGFAGAMPMLVASVIAGMIGCGGFALLTLPAAAIAYSTPMALGALWVLATSNDPVLYALGGLLIFCHMVVSVSCLAHAKIFADRLVAAEELEKQKQVVSLLLSDFEEGASDWLWEVDAVGALTYVSDRMAAAAGVDKAVLIGQPMSELCGAAETPTGPVAALSALFAEQKAFRDVTVSVAVGPDSQNKQTHWWSLSAKPVHDLSGLFTGFRGVGADITQAREDQARISRLAHYDVLTQLPNRLSFLQALSKAWTDHGKPRSKGGAGAGCAVLCLDLDHFKGVNDSLGHPIGDDLLIQASARLRDCVDDLVGDGGLVSRLGGDEFAVVIAPSPGHAALGELARAIVSALSLPYDVRGHHVLIGASVGIAVAPFDADDPDGLLKNADLALYRAKGDGRGAYRFFETAMDIWAQERRALELDLRDALAKDELKLFFQPLIGSGEHEVTGFEALLRWQHPTRGLVAPADFIECAEQWGLIGAIGEWVLFEACHTAAAWPSHLSVAVNLSPNQFATGDLVSQVRKALKVSGLAPARLELEITEGLLLHDSVKTLKQLAALKALGVKIAMDDFGTGYSSLAYLWRFPFDKIKIDRSFVAEMQDNTAIADILRTVALLGQTLNLKVTAEGVETAAQARLLADMRCDTFQGFLYGRPMPVGDIPSFLLSNMAQQMRRAGEDADDGDALTG